MSASSSPNKSMQNVLFKNVLEKDEFLYVHDVEERLQCVVCKAVAIPLLRATCQHSFCKDCVSESKTVKCPIDLQYTPRQNMQEDINTEAVHKIPVFCLNSCGKQMLLGNLKNHLIKCRHDLGLNILKCRQGCGKLILQKDLATHEDTECDLRMDNCLHCKLYFPFRELVEHDMICGKKLVACQECGITDILNEDMAAHKDQVCLETKRPCMFRSIGCAFTRNRMEVEGHEKQFDAHAHLFMEHAEKSAKNSQKNTDNTERFTELLEELQKEQEQSKNRLNDILEQQRVLSENYKTLQLKVRDEIRGAKRDITFLCKLIKRIGLGLVLIIMFYFIYGYFFTRSVNNFDRIRNIIEELEDDRGKEILSFYLDKLRGIDDNDNTLQRNVNDKIREFKQDIKEIMLTLSRLSQRLWEESL